MKHSRTDLKAAIGIIQDLCLEAQEGRSDYIYLKVGSMGHDSSPQLEMYIGHSRIATPLLGAVASVGIATDDAFDLLERSKHWVDKDTLIKTIDELTEKRDELTTLISKAERQIMGGM